MRHRSAAAVLAALILAGGCAGGGSGDADSAQRPPGTSRASSSTAPTQATDVAPCPDLPRRQPVEGGLPALTLPCLGDGPDVRLSDLRGTPTVVNVWAAWCVNCDREMPLFAAAMDRLGERVRFFGIHYKAARAYGLQSQADFQVPFPSVHDEDGDRVAAQLRATAPPQTFFVAADGRVVGHKIGEIRSEQELLDLIAEHLAVDA